MCVCVFGFFFMFFHTFTEWSLKFLTCRYKYLCKRQSALYDNWVDPKFSTFLSFCYYQWSRLVKVLGLKEGKKWKNSAKISVIWVGKEPISLTHIFSEIEILPISILSVDRIVFLETLKIVNPLSSNTTKCVFLCFWEDFLFTMSFKRSCFFLPVWLLIRLLLFFSDKISWVFQQHAQFCGRTLIFSRLRSC